MNEVYESLVGDPRDGLEAQWVVRWGERGGMCGHQPSAPRHRSCVTRARVKQRFK